MNLGAVNGDMLVESIVRVVDGVSVHRYRLVGGPDDGREFASLLEVYAYVRERGHRQS